MYVIPYDQIYYSYTGPITGPDLRLWDLKTTRNISYTIDLEEIETRNPITNMQTFLEGHTYTVSEDGTTITTTMQQDSTKTHIQTPNAYDKNRLITSRVDSDISISLPVQLENEYPTIFTFIFRGIDDLNNTLKSNIIFDFSPVISMADLPSNQSDFPMWILYSLASVTLLVIILRTDKGKKFFRMVNEAMKGWNL